ncbi:MAG: HAMP domain-containing sensor histidine kinase [Spirochaetales bacterium]|nr:HAMP domain-containing sensor histidine kinase [Spirochaetales bacterium]
MTGKQGQTFLIILFPLILIPAFILAYFAFGAVNQDEYIQRRRLENSLLQELDQTNGRIQLVLDEMVEDLYRSLPKDLSLYHDNWIDDWEENQNLAGTVFLLNGEGEIVFPALDSTEKANLFYWRYMNFFSGEEAIPVYQSIAEEYSEEILAEEVLAEDIPNDSSAPPSPAMAEAPAAMSLAEAEPLPQAKSTLRTQEAASLFELDEEVQERVYGLAEEEGQVYLKRNVLPQLETLPETEEETQTVVRSVYMESTRYFEEIVLQGEFGLIPRLFDSTFTLLFWARQGDLIVGCELDMEEVKNRLSAAIALPAGEVRLMNILDNRGEALIPQSDKGREEWRRPFVAKEISEYLPYWETAILLKNPEEFQRQLESSRYLLTFMIATLTVILIGAMILIFRLSTRQIKEVRQRVGFVANVSHELKTPLTSIRLYSEMLSQGDRSDPEKIGKYADYIAAESQRLTRLINNVLDFARWDRGNFKEKKELIELNDLAESVLEGLREEYEKAGFTLKLTLSTDPLELWADKEAIVQVILNLLSNGKKYSREQKELVLETGKKGKEIYLSVSDRGIGIPRKYRKKIFRQFFRVDTSLTTRYGGTGLGLAIARQIMKNHRGRLVYSSRDREGGGSRFTMVFPLKEMRSKK